MEVLLDIGGWVGLVWTAIEVLLTPFFISKDGPVKASGYTIILIRAPFTILVSGRILGWW